MAADAQGRGREDRVARRSRADTREHSCLVNAGTLLQRRDIGHTDHLAAQSGRSAGVIERYPDAPETAFDIMIVRSSPWNSSRTILKPNVA